MRGAGGEAGGRGRSLGLLLLFMLPAAALAQPLPNVQVADSVATAPSPGATLPGTPPGPGLPSVGPLQAFLGSLHDHTAEGGDDGTGTVAEALTAARAAGFDFMGLSPHNHMISPETYAALVESAQGASQDGGFVALPAFEWGIISKGGHVGVVGAGELCKLGSRKWDRFWKWLESRTEPTVQVLNHPVWNRRFGGAPTPARAARAHLMEVMGGPAYWRGGPGLARAEFYFESLCRSLNQGWRVGVVAGEDDHTGQWGRVGPTRTGVWAPELTRPAILEGLAARRTFVTEDPRMRVWIEVDGAPMGSELPWKGEGGSYRLSFRVDHEDDEAPRVAVYADLDGVGGDLAQELARPEGGLLELRPRAPGAFVLLVARDADEDVAISSPIFLGAPQRYLTEAQEAAGEDLRPDPNFAVALALDDVPGLGEATARRLVTARRRGALFLEPQDLLAVKGFPQQDFARIQAGLRFPSPEQLVTRLHRLEADLSSLVIPEGRKELVELQLRRVERLLAAHLERLLATSSLDRAREVRGRLLGLGPAHEALTERVDRAVRQSMIEAGTPERAEELFEG